MQHFGLLKERRAAIFTHIDANADGSISLEDVLVISKRMAHIRQMLASYLHSQFQFDISQSPALCFGECSKSWGGSIGRGPQETSVPAEFCIGAIAFSMLFINTQLSFPIDRFIFFIYSYICLYI